MRDQGFEPLPQRLLALDAMRGLTLALMIVVNMSLSETQAYAPLLHAAWNGLTLTDLVFPSFLFVVGSAMSFTLGRYQAQGSAVVLQKVARRTALIFLCGYLLYWFPFFSLDAAGQLALRPLANTRIPGVLQRIALSYGCAALVVHFWRARGALAFSAAALLTYWWLLRTFGDDTMAGNAVLRLDRWLLGDNHLYKGEGIAFDPEGVLSTLPAIVNVLAGWLAGRWLIDRGSRGATVVQLLLAGVACIAVASAWDTVLPFNKKLWTSSYALVGCGAASVLLATLVAVIDLARWRRWTGFFIVFGRNTLVLYLVAELGMAVLWLTEVRGQPSMLSFFEHAIQPWAGAKPGGLLYALLYMLLVWLLGWWMDRRRIYVRL